MSREKIFLRVVKGALVPADDYAMNKIRSRGFRVIEQMAETFVGE